VIDMAPQAIAFETVRKRLLRKPTVKAAYDALEPEFAVADALIKARARAKLTQAQLAERMGTTQPYVAKLESGRAKPTLRTLERIAEATGSRLRFVFEAA
jgi:ribosome-binding protein aMBF1 (putative translation factor)